MNTDGDVNITDKTIWKNQTGTQGYKSRDFDMNSEVMNQDKNDYWIENNGKQTQVPD